jgi:hypothetical protein
VHKKDILTNLVWGRRGRVRMVVGFTTTYAFNAYHIPHLDGKYVLFMHPVVPPVRVRPLTCIYCNIT